MVISFRPGRSGQTVQTQIRLLLEEQFDLGLHCLEEQFDLGLHCLEEQFDPGLHCLQFHLHLFDEIPKDLASLFEF